MAEPGDHQDIDDPLGGAAVASGLAALDLHELDKDTFEGESLPLPGGRVFGGQVLGQALIAAGRTVDGSRHAHSLHGYFLRPGDASKPIRFEVEEMRDGGSFSARRTHAIQDGRPILSMIASFQVAQSGPEHAVTMPEVPPPSAVTSGVTVLSEFRGHANADFWLERAPFDVRHVEGSLFTSRDPKPKAYQTTWMRVRRPLGDVPELVHRALIAFGCDQVMLEPLMRRHGVSWIDRNFSFASLDHAMWWHRPARADEWLLYVQDTPTAQGGRGLTGAWVFAEDGRLVATIAQEGMIRLRD